MEGGGVVVSRAYGSHMFSRKDHTGFATKVQAMRDGYVLIYTYSRVLKKVDGTMAQLVQRCASAVFFSGMFLREPPLRAHHTCAGI